MAQLTIPEVQEIQGRLSAIRSQRGRVMQGMKEILTTITKARGYSWEVTEVSFNVKSWKDKATAETPVIYIIDDTTQLTRHAGCVREYKQFLRLFGVVREHDILEFEEFIADIEECVKDNNTLCGFVNFMEVVEVTTDNQLFSELDGTHLFEMVVEVNYTRHFKNPK